MKHRIKNLTGFTIGATDGEIGKVNEFYFDDDTWTVRYLIVETGSWLWGRKVLISTKALLTPDWKEKTFQVNLTMEQIKNSPPIDTDKPVSRQHEMELYTYYPWGNYYWGGAMGSPGIGMSYPVSLDMGAGRDKSNDDTHLRSTDKVKGYHIEAINGEIGDVEDFILDDSTWEIAFILVDTGNWFPGKKVLVSPKWIKEISWVNSTVIVNASEEQVKNSPEYEPSQQVSESYEANLQNHYGRFISHK